MTSLVSENGPSVTVILPLASRTRTPSLLGSRPPVSTRVPSFNDFSTNLPIASSNAGGGGDLRYDSEWRMNVRYFMAPPVGFDQTTNEPGPDRHAGNLFSRWERWSHQSAADSSAYAARNQCRLFSKFVPASG